MADPIKDIWADDLIGRQKIAEFLTKYLEKKCLSDSSSNGFVLNINSGWGFGKTYFLTRWHQQLQYQEYPVVYFDAWKNDFSDQALLSFIAELDVSFKKLFHEKKAIAKRGRELIKKSGKLILAATPVLLNAAVQSTLGVSPATIANATELGKAVEKAAEEALKRHQSTQASIEAFRSSLATLVETIKASSLRPPLFILVDELDRCRPLYAIELLEAIKHLFGVPGVCFVIATDTKQLASSVQAVYGSNFDGQRYLKRFFDQEYVLPEPDYFQFALVFSKNLNAKNLLAPFNARNEQPVADILAVINQSFGLDLRSQDQCFTQLEAICADEKTKWYIPLLYFLIVSRHTDPNSFDLFALSPLDQLDKLLLNLSKEKRYFTYRLNNHREQVELSAFDLIQQGLTFFRKAKLDWGANSPSESSSRMEHAIFDHLTSHPNHFELFKNYPRIITQAKYLTS